VPKILTVYGTRPEAIKVAPILSALDRSTDFDSVPVVTGQHREMLDQVNHLFEIEPKHDLDVHEAGQTLTSITHRVLTRLDPVLEAEKPDAVVVQGDTTTSMAAALAAFYRQIPIVHLEAGLRSGDITSPYPEEANRKIISQLARLHLAPTEHAAKALTAEAFDRASIVVTGNTVIDALLDVVRREPGIEDPRLAAVLDSPHRVLTVTAHRRENWGEPMVQIGRALAQISDAFPDLQIVFPIHRNPLVRQAVMPAFEGHDNILVIEPLSYAEFAIVLARSHIVLTDSGGVQEEAPSLGKPVLVMRENTERPEAVAAGTVQLIGTDQARIVAEVTRLLTDEAAYVAMAKAVNPYGDGHASERSIAALQHLFGLGDRLPDFSPA
jgi:UDP-N-acetylglucosamine 2-epimerase (non-hydrolysing)